MSALKGQNMAGQDIFSTSTTQQTDLGAFETAGDGRGFRYVLAGTTLIPGQLYQSQAESTSLQNLAIAASAIGSTSIVTTSTVTVTANQFAGGQINVTTSTGAGYSYKIASHPAATSAVVTFTLEDPIIVALTTSSKIDVVANPFASIVLNPTTPTGAPVGVAVYPIANGSYGWLQTHGQANVLADGALQVGSSVCASNGTAGAVEVLTGSQVLVGFTITSIANTEYGSVFLTID